MQMQIQMQQHANLYESVDHPVDPFNTSIGWLEK